MRRAALPLVCLVAGCATRALPQPPPAAPPPMVVSLPVGTGLPPGSPVLPPPVDPVSPIVERAEDAFAAGLAEWQAGRHEAARTHFDRVVLDLLLLPAGARGEPRVRGTYESLLDRISALEILALRESESVSASSSVPAAIDELLNSGLIEPPQPEATTADTVAADLARLPRDLPIPLHPKVLSYVELFQGRLRDFMQGGLNRAQRYLPMIEGVFRREGLPLDLAFVPLVESAFKPTALSRASARGMWQFMLGTAQEHGLSQTWFVDDRADPEKATRAAAAYLKTLSGAFDGDWHLALASYNAGPGRLQSALRRSKRSSFWDLISNPRLLPRETREYVPMILAAVVIARNPALYGFQVDAAAPLAYETVEIPGALELARLAEWAGITVGDLQDLNPALRRMLTPMAPFALKVPVGTAASIQARLGSVDQSEYRTFKFHVVRRGETLTTIARRYKLTTAQLREANDLRSSRVARNQTLMIPARTTAALPSPPAARASATAASSGATYRVRPGDTLFSIARQFETTVDTLRQLNRLAGDRINIGDRLTVRR